MGGNSQQGGINNLFLIRPLRPIILIPRCRENGGGARGNVDLWPREIEKSNQPGDFDHLMRHTHLNEVLVCASYFNAFFVATHLAAQAPDKEKLLIYNKDEPCGTVAVPDFASCGCSY